MGLMRAYQQLETCSAPDRDLSLLLSVHKVSHNHNDTLIQLDLSHGAVASGISDIKYVWGVRDVNREMAASHLNVFNIFFRQLAEGGNPGKNCLYN